MPIKESELILNPDGSIYHLNLKPEHVADDIIFVGDQDRVARISRHFEQVEIRIQKREFITHTGFYKGKRLTVISTGIGPDNIDIVLNELDALVNIDLKTRTPYPELRSLNVIRIGTSGSLQADIPVDSFVLSTHGLDLNGMLHYYKIEPHTNPDIENAFIEKTSWSSNKARPLIIGNSTKLEQRFDGAGIHKGITATAGGFYGPQGRVLRLPLQDTNLNVDMDNFEFQGNRISNFEMETSVIYGLSKLMGHHALSMNAIIANRVNGQFSSDPKKVVDDLILYCLNKFID